jgi:DnaJ-class molecular chaperone
MSHYEILGVDPKASSDQIKKAFRKLSLETHPDRPGGDASRFQKINEAYEQLSDDRTRKQYDMSLNPQQINIFDMLFGGGHDIPIPQAHFFQGSGIPPGFMSMFKPPPLTVQVEITLDQAYTGCSVPITIERWVQSHHIKQLEKETMYIDIPAGIDSNEGLLLPRKGNAGPDGEFGDVKVMITVKNNTKLERRGLDLWYTHTITLKEALCGFSFDMEYLHGKIYKINNVGTIISPQYKKILQGMGIKRDQLQGNLIITFIINFPSSLSDSTITALQTLL